MSVIIAGDKCKGCGKPYMISLGHPQWFDDVVKHGKPKSQQFKLFENMRLSGYCPECYCIVEAGKQLGKVKRVLPKRRGRTDED